MTVFQTILRITGIVIVTIALLSPASARMVVVEGGTGSGLLFNRNGLCFVIMPSHLHGLMNQGIQISAPGTEAIGTAKVIFESDKQTDLSLGLVRGSITGDCGMDWSQLPRSADDILVQGKRLMLHRSRLKADEGRMVRVHTVTIDQFKIVPDGGEIADFYGGTSGSFVFDGEAPIGMVVTADATNEAWALRIDEIVHRISRTMGYVPQTQECGSGESNLLSLCSASDKSPGKGDAFKVLAWSTHNTNDSFDPVAMANGEGPYIAPVSPANPIVIELRLTETDRLSRIQIRSQPSEGTFLPQSVEIVTDPTDGPVRRPNPFPRRDMAPDGIYDVRIGERFAKLVTIRITSTWGGGSPARIDSITID